MLDCKGCKYYVYECKVINTICSEHSTDLTSCPFVSGINRLIAWLVENVGMVTVRYSKIGSKYYVIAKVSKSFNLTTVHTIAIAESSLFDEIEDALTDTLFKLYEKLEKEGIL